jgi:hypothetical protein
LVDDTHFGHSTGGSRYGCLQEGIKMAGVRTRANPAKKLSPVHNIFGLKPLIRSEKPGKEKPAIYLGWILSVIIKIV